jgi:hypothetical protein
MCARLRKLYKKPSQPVTEGQTRHQRSRMCKVMTRAQRFRKHFEQAAATATGGRNCLRVSPNTRPCDVCGCTPGRGARSYTRAGAILRITLQVLFTTTTGGRMSPQRERGPLRPPLAPRKATPAQNGRQTRTLARQPRGPGRATG